MKFLAKKHLKWGVFYSSFLFMACSPNKPTILETCNKCESTIFKDQKLNPVIDSLSFEKADSLGELSPNIPPKMLKHSIILFTQKNYLIYYKLIKGKKHYQIQDVIHIPVIHESISDFLVIKDDKILITWNDNPEIFTWYNPQNKKHTDHKFNKNAVGKITPFLNFGLSRYNNKFLFPIVSSEDAANENNVFGIFDQNINYQKGLGNFENHHLELFAPFSDSPITSTINGDVFFVSSSTSNGTVKFNLRTNSHNKVPFCFSKQLSKQLKKDIPKSKLSDFKTLEEKYISSSYIISLHATVNKLIRISKNKQSFYDTISGLKNTMINASWNMEILDLKSDRGFIRYFKPNKYVFTNTITTNEKVYVLSNNPSEKHFIYHAFI